MSPRLRQYLKISPFMAGLFLATDGVSIPIMFLLVTGFLLFFLPVRCPQCGKRVDYNRTKVFLDGWGYTVCVPKRCSACRYPLSGWLDSIVMTVESRG